MTSSSATGAPNADSITSMSIGSPARMSDAETTRSDWSAKLSTIIITWIGSSDVEATVHSPPRGSWLAGTCSVARPVPRAISGPAPTDGGSASNETSAPDSATARIDTAPTVPGTSTRNASVAASSRVVRATCHVLPCSDCWSAHVAPTWNSAFESA
ncbi:MAG: hypothetical protein AAF602_03470 [Myxococcota bacterium]